MNTNSLLKRILIRFIAIISPIFFIILPFFCIIIFPLKGLIKGTLGGCNDFISFWKTNYNLKVTKSYIGGLKTAFFDWSDDAVTKYYDKKHKACIKDMEDRKFGKNDC